MERTIILTSDGSHTISIPEMNVTYHSAHGAIQESMHVFIKAGLHAAGRSPGFKNANGLYKRPDPYRILEIGLGTGLNALLTLIEAEKSGITICYEALELYPLSREEFGSLNYCQLLNRPDLQPIFEQMHTGDWEKEIKLTPQFTLNKKQITPTNYSNSDPVNLIYFDAFAPAVQPELWTKEIFEKLFKMMTPGGILVTYCSKADVRRAMQAAGFTVEKIPGPWGKREMLRARL